LSQDIYWLVMVKNPVHKPCIVLFPAGYFILLLALYTEQVEAQGSWYWNQSLNAEASLLSGAVVAGESGIAAIFYNPATIPEMTRNNLSLSANLFSLTVYNARNALGTDFPANRTQLDIQPRVLTLTLNPRKKPDLTIEIAYFCKTNDYLQINQGTSLTADVITANPGDEHYTADFYFRTRFQDYYGGIGLGYKLSSSLAVGFSGMFSYKDDQYYNLITTSAFTGPGSSEQYLSEAMYNLKYNMFDVRFITKLGLHWKKNLWSFGMNLNIPSLKIFGDGTVVKQYEYSNIHKIAGNPESSSTYYGGRQRKCSSHFKDPFSIAAGTNYYTASGNAVFLFTAEYFFGLSEFDYIEAKKEPGEDGYHYAPGEPEEWLSFKSQQRPMFNAGIAFRQRLSGELMFSGGFRTDFHYTKPVQEEEYLTHNQKVFYAFDLYHFNYGLGYGFKRGSIILGMQFTHGRANDQRQIVNLTEPVEYIDDAQLPLTGPINHNVQIRYNDVMIYFGFVFNFLKESQ
jgi:hypothetical protein